MITLPKPDQYLHVMLVPKRKRSLQLRVGSSLLCNWTFLKTEGKANPQLVCRWCFQMLPGGEKNDVQKRSVQFRIDLPGRMSRFLLEVTGKFQFHSLIHCWAFCLKSWRKAELRSLPRWAGSLKGSTLPSLIWSCGQAFACREAHTSMAVAHSPWLPWLQRLFWG